MAGRKDRGNSSQGTVTSAGQGERFDVAMVNYGREEKGLPLVATITRKPWTAEELARLPEGWRYEIDQGELIITAPAGWRHNRVVSRIARLLGNFVAGHGLGEVITNELGVLLSASPQTLRAPDVAYFTPEQVASIGNEQGYPRVVPALVVEVHDPSEPDLSRKVEQFLAAGARAVWVVDPETPRLTRHALGAPPRTWSGPGAVVQEPLLPGFACSLGELVGEGGTTGGSNL